MAVIILALAIAAVVHVWFSGPAFVPLVKWVQARQLSARWYARWPAIGLSCHFCVSCKLALAWAIWSGDYLTSAAAILPANLAILVIAKWPALLDSTIAKRRLEIRMLRLQQGLCPVCGERPNEQGNACAQCRSLGLRRAA